MRLRMKKGLWVFGREKGNRGRSGLLWRGGVGRGDLWGIHELVRWKGGWRVTRIASRLRRGLRALWVLVSVKYIQVKRVGVR